MSRIGKQPVNILPGVKVSVAGNVVNVEGPKGKLSKPFPSEIGVVVNGAVVNVSDLTADQSASALHGTV
ncbi:MAG: 50S ribosomal protein L6, partial [Verrucomicrobiota bacterium]